MRWKRISSLIFSTQAHTLYRGPTENTEKPSDLLHNPYIATLDWVGIYEYIFGRWILSSCVFVI